jgi:hypothetical protein
LASGGAPSCAMRMYSRSEAARRSAFTSSLVPSVAAAALAARRRPAVVCE